MPRVKGSPKKLIKSNIQETANTWVFLLKGEAFEIPEQYTGTGTPDIVTLRHPNSGQPSLFLFSPTNSSVQEILTFSEDKRSWFIDESVKSDGKLHLSTPVDPIFLVLPYIRKYCSTQAVPLNQLLIDDEFPETKRLLKSAGLKYLNLVADKKGDDDLNAFKYNEEKTLTWLQKKTERVAEILKQKNIHVTAGAASATFVKSSKVEQSDEAYLRYAHGIISEYLMDDLSSKLLKQLALPEESPQNTCNKRKSISNLPTDAKKVKHSESPPKAGILDLSKSESKPKVSILTAKEKARAKAATSSKNISSFFKKK